MFKYLLVLSFFFYNSNSVNQTTAAPKHDFYLSICEIIHKKDSQTLEITFRFFSDDLEKIVFNYDHTKISTDFGKKAEGSDKSLFNYLKEHFSIYNKKNKEIEYEFIGWETDKEHSWCYVEAKYKQFSELKVKNNLMIELFAGQKNLVYLKSGSKETSVLLDKNKTVDVLKLE